MTSTSANDRQVGGDHYQKKEYQHWDWVCDINLHYLLACATKYVARWRDKNGIQDLEKARHYLGKAAEQDSLLAPGEKLFPAYSDAYISATRRFAVQLPSVECDVVWKIVGGHYPAADIAIRRLIAAEQEESATESPTPASPA